MSSSPPLSPTTTRPPPTAATITTTTRPPPPKTTTMPHRPTPAPTPSAPTTTLTIQNFRISTTKLPILNSSEIDAMTAKLGITPPEMIFGNNEVRIELLGGGGGEVVGEGGEGSKGSEREREGDEGEGKEVFWGISFNALDALDLVDKTGAKGMLKVAYSEEWQKQREKVHGASIKEYVRPFDWSYTTAYRGTVLPRAIQGDGDGNRDGGGDGDGDGASGETQTATVSTETSILESSTKETSTIISTSTSPSSLLNIPPQSTLSPPPPAKYPLTLQPSTPTPTLPTPLLLLPDPILLFDKLVLYEDELADNGISLYEVKIRVMPHRLLVLARFFLRLDDVLFRVRDTRVYIDFAVPGAPGEGRNGEGKPKPVVMREYLEKEATWVEVLERMAKEGVRRSEVASVLRDADRVEGWLGVVKREMERAVLG